LTSWPQAWTDPKQLASVMIATLDDHTPAREAAQAEKARNDLPRRVAGFAADYENIVLETVAAAR
jgi:hypothetical protein